MIWILWLLSLFVLIFLLFWCFSLLPSTRKAVWEVEQEADDP